MWSKRASLELSANAIVILIIAITILGLGLSFVRTVFTGLTEKISTEAGRSELSEPPSPARPITTLTNLELARGKKVTIKMGFYNNENEEITSTKPEIVSCVGGIPSGSWQESAMPQITSSSKHVALGESVQFNAIIQGSSTMPKGDSVCTLRISKTEVEFFISVPG